MITLMEQLTVGFACILKIQMELKREPGNIKYMGIKWPEKKVIRSEFDNEITQIIDQLCGR